MSALIIVALASTTVPAVARWVDCRPSLMLMAYEAPQASERQKREKPRKTPRNAPPCITLASA